MKGFYAGGFLFNPLTEEILLHKRDDKTTKHPNKWAFFGGSSEEGETPLQTFVREIKEELGITIQIDEVMPLRNYLNPEFGTQRHVFYVVRDTPKNQMVLGEGADFDWVPLGKVFGYDATPMTLNDITYFLQEKL